MRPPAVRRATAADHEAAAEALALAFIKDPVVAHLLPKGDTGERLLAFFAAEIANLVPEWREVWIADDGSAAAVWASPGRWRVPLHRTMRALPQMRKVLGRRLALAIWTLLRAEGRHPKRPDHWYLHYLGVEPRSQGRGLGSALLGPVLEHCDAAGVPAYLESSTERSRRLYERNGFALTAVFRTPAGGPPVRQMWREPR